MKYTLPYMPWFIFNILQAQQIRTLQSIMNKACLKFKPLLIQMNGRGNLDPENGGGLSPNSPPHHGSKIQTFIDDNESLRSILLAKKRIGIFLLRISGKKIK